jgi:hypothetical protein
MWSGSGVELGSVDSTWYCLELSMMACFSDLDEFPVLQRHPIPERLRRPILKRSSRLWNWLYTSTHLSGPSGAIQSGRVQRGLVMSTFRSMSLVRDWSLVRCGSLIPEAQSPEILSWAYAGKMRQLPDQRKALDVRGSGVVVGTNVLAPLISSIEGNRILMVLLDNCCQCLKYLASTQHLSCSSRSCSS